MHGSSPTTTNPLLEVDDLTVEYPGGRRRKAVRAVDRVSFGIGNGETVGLVGESGSGKSTIGRTILGLVPVTDGHIRLDGVEITDATYGERRRLSSSLQVVFQDPYSSLNPTRTIGQTLVESLHRHDNLGREEKRQRVKAMLERVGLPAEASNRFPAAFSGGQRQRIAIARALMVQPRLVVCDEPVSALDLSVQAQILNLLAEIQQEYGISYLFIAHDLAVVRHLSHRVLVLYNGQIMEHGDASTLYRRPRHPYTWTLLEASPVPDPSEQERRRTTRRERRLLSSSPGDRAATELVGCPFAPRCVYATDLCGTTRPVMEVTEDRSSIACHHWRNLTMPAYLDQHVVDGPHGGTATASAVPVRRRRPL